jgi:hypothetical protein
VIAWLTAVAGLFTPACEGECLTPGGVQSVPGFAFVIAPIMFSLAGLARGDGDWERIGWVAFALLTILAYLLTPFALSQQME